MNQLALGNGAYELLCLISKAFVGYGNHALIYEKTFPGYEWALRFGGAKANYLPLSDYTHSVDVLRKYHNQLVFICNPHNPCGTQLGKTEIEELFSIAQKNNLFLVIDEAYAEYADSHFHTSIPMATESDNCIVLRTFSKAYGLTGLRVGYAIGSKISIKILNQIIDLLPFHINSVAQNAAVAALEDQLFLQHVINQNNVVKRFTQSRLKDMHTPFVPSFTNFILVKDPTLSGTLHHTLLKQHAIYTADVSSQGLHSHIRLSLGTLEQMQCFLEVFDHYLGRRIRG